MRVTETLLDGTIIEYDTPTTPEQVDAERDRRICSGMTYTVGGVAYRFQTDRESRENVHGVATLALAAIMKGAVAGDLLWHKPADGVTPFTFIAADNRLAQMDAQTAFDFGQTMARHKSAHVYAARKLKDTVPIPLDYTADHRWP